MKTYVLLYGNACAIFDESFSVGESIESTLAAVRLWLLAMFDSSLPSGSLTTYLCCDRVAI